jgi:hypothetical protein
MRNNLLSITLAIIIIILICIISKLLYAKITDHKTFLEGFWESSSEFCEKSDLQGAFIYLSYDDENTCWMYILLNSSSETKLNLCIPVDLKNNVLHNIGHDNIEFDIIANEDISPLPQEMKCRVNINNGVMMLYHEDTIHLELFKNNKASLGLM